MHLYLLPFLLLCLLIPNISLAALGSIKEKWYEVEVIVFAQNNEESTEAEFWPEKVEFPKMKNSIELINEFELFIDDDIEKLPLYYLEIEEEREDTLESLAAKLRNSSRYELLIHRSWRQVVPERSSGIPVYLDDRIENALYYQPTQPKADSSETFLENGDPAEAALMAALLEEERALQNQQSVDSLLINEFDPITPFDEIEGLPVTEPVQLGPNGPPFHRVYGTLKLHKSRYLHLSVDFLYRADPIEPKEVETPVEELFPMAPQEIQLSGLPLEATAMKQDAEDVPALEMLNKEKAPLAGFQLKDSTRVRISNVYYFDHPMFGVIARVIPYELPEPEILDEFDLEEAAIE